MSEQVTIAKGETKVVKSAAAIEMAENGTLQWKGLNCQVLDGEQYKGEISNGKEMSVCKGWTACVQQGSLSLS